VRTDGADTSSTAPTGEAFFDPPVPLPPGQPGAVVRSATFDAFHGAQGYRLLFHSTSSAGIDVAVSGRVFVPPAGAGRQADGRIAVVAQSRGSVADRCAASRDPSYERDAQPVGNWSERDFAELPLTAGTSLSSPTTRALARLDPDGFSTDRVPATTCSTQLVPPALCSKLLTHQWWPLETPRVLTPAGRDKLKSFETVCGQDVIDSISTDAATDYLTAPEAPADDFLEVLDHNSPGDIPTGIPIMLLHGANAEPIPQVVSDLLFAHLCETGGYTIEYRKHPGSAEQANLDNEPYLLSWLDDRVAGSDAPTTPCP